MPRFDLPLADLENYRPAVAEPSDFDEFWEATISAARSVGGEVSVTPIETALSEIDAFDVTFPGFAGEPIRAWLLLPARRSGPLPAVVEFNGYGGGRGLPIERLGWAASGYAHLFMDTRGQGSAWGSGGATADPHGTGPSFSGFMTRGIEAPEHYYYRRVFTDAVRAVDAVRSLPEVDAARVAVCGGSQGGGISLAAAALSDDLVAVMSDVPFLCHFERAVGMTGQDPYQEIVRYLAVHRGAESNVFETLSYFDGVNFARRARTAGLFSVGLLDPICPPSTVYAAFNAFAGDDKEIVVYPFNEHEGGQAHQWTAQARFLAERV
ncbi:acetylxylan esterase [Microbacterium radiodurans]|uniref:Acetylxylan esterase n=1 Tax=Microbacterium radiodurans TaxID=661398 RepID=A0A5J5IPA9_9MICO|nr:acetylxylan esterase [Microbacterium radiodurans]KAA9084988.1 acetylxylan esterase [Microbacterium radiodurans]